MELKFEVQLNQTTFFFSFQLPQVAATQTEITSVNLQCLQPAAKNVPVVLGITLS